MTTAKVLSLSIEGGKITLVYDKHCRKYTVQRIGSNGKVFETKTEYDTEETVRYLDKFAKGDIDPILPVVRKAISAGLDPTTLYGLGDRVN